MNNLESALEAINNNKENPALEDFLSKKTVFMINAHIYMKKEHNMDLMTALKNTEKRKIVKSFVEGMMSTRKIQCPWKCAGCDNDLNPIQIRNALSQYKHGYICNNCGLMEAVTGDFIKRLKKL